MMRIVSQPWFAHPFAQMAYAVRGNGWRHCSAADPSKLHSSTADKWRLHKSTVRNDPDRASQDNCRTFGRSPRMAWSRPANKDWNISITTKDIRVWCSPNEEYSRNARPLRPRRTWKCWRWHEQPLSGTSSLGQLCELKIVERHYTTYHQSQHNKLDRIGVPERRLTRWLW